MKHFKITSILLSVSMCMSMIAAPVLVFADETTVPSENETVETTGNPEPKETKKSVPNETEKQKPIETEKKDTEETQKQIPEETEIYIDSTSPSDLKETEETNESANPDSSSSETKPSESAKTGETTETTSPTKPVEASKPDETTIPSESTKETENSGSANTEPDIPETSESTPEKEAKRAPKNASYIANGTVGSINWVLENDGTLVISGNGPLTVSYLINDSWPWHSYDDQIKKLVIQEGVTKIGWLAFHDLDYLETVSLPSTLKTIGYYSFKNDISLKSIEFPSGLECVEHEAFTGCVKLSNIIIPKNVDFEYGVFSGCTGLTSVTVTEGVTYISCELFNGCIGLKTIKLPISLRWIDEDAFAGCSVKDVYYAGTQDDWDSLVNIYKNNDSIKNSTKHFSPPPTSGKCGDNITWEFSGNTLKLSGSGEMYDYEYWWSNREPDTKPWRYYVDEIKTVSFSGNITSIGEFAFCKCINLTSISIPTSVTSIGSFAFDSCKSLSSVTIPSSVIKIGAGAFEYSGITSIVIPDNVTELEHAAFYRCESLSEVKLSKSLKTLEYSMFEYCKSLNSITIPNGITEISDYAFNYCSSLSSVNLPDSLTQIATNSFSGCTKLTSIAIPKNVTDIWDYAFANCSGLTNITLPEGLKELGSGAFYGCTGLTYVTVPSSTIKIGTSAFLKTSLNVVTYEGYKSDWENIKVEVYDSEIDEYVERSMKDVFSKVFPEVTVIFNICGKVGHNITHVDAKVPTEDSTGYDEHYKCNNCGKIFLDAEGKNETTLDSIKLCLITISSVSNCTATVSKSIAHVGEDILLTVNPDEGYELTSIKVNGSGITGTTFSVPSENVVVEVVVAKIKAENTLKVTGGKTAKVKYKKLRKKAQVVARAKMMNVSGAQGKLVYKILSVNKKKTYFKINSTNGVITVKKKLKKGTYTIKVSVTATGNDDYKSVTKTSWFKIKVK